MTTRRLFPCLLLAMLCLAQGCISARNLVSIGIGTLAKTPAALSGYTPQQEEELGRTTAGQLLSTYPAYADPALNTYVNTLGQALAMNSRQPLTFGGYRFQVVDSQDINAFAMPGGIILVTRGLVGACNSESELAAVLAHEIAHVQNKDAIAAIKTARSSKLMAEMGRDLVKASAASGALGYVERLTGAADDMIATMITTGYSRDQELAADKAAVEILRSSGYAPQGLSAMLQVLAAKGQGRSTGFYATHPSPQDRLAQLSATNEASAAFAQGAVADNAVRQKRFRKALARFPKG